MALHGDAYGQDTRGIDFARVPYDQIFTLNGQGDSIAFDPAALMQPSPLLDLHRYTDPEPAYFAEPNSAAGKAFQRPQAPGTNALDVLFGKIEPASPATAADDGPADKSDQTTVLIGVWVAIATLAFLAVVLFDFSIVFAFILAVALGRMLHKPKVLSALTRATRRMGQYEYRPPQR